MIWQKVNKMDISASAVKLHRESVVIDPCVQYLTEKTERTDKSGLTAVGITVPGVGDDYFDAIDRVKGFYRVIADNPSFCMGNTVEAIRQAHTEGKLAHIFGAQNSLMIGSDPGNLILWKQMGLTFCQLTYNEKTLAGSGCIELNDDGISQFGKVLVREMSRVGVTLDLSHVGERTFMQAVEVAQAPVLVSHSNPKAVVDNPRNITDDQMKAVADTGGIICVTTWAPLIYRGGDQMPTLDDYLVCLEYALELVGIDHVGTSTDSMGTMGAYPPHDFSDDDLPYHLVTDPLDKNANPPDTNNRQPSDFNGIEDYPYLTHKLLERGYSEEEVKKILGENLMRVFEQTLKPNLLV